jgi:hypothetical protein
MSLNIYNFDLFEPMHSVFNPLEVWSGEDQTAHSKLLDTGILESKESLLTHFLLNECQKLYTYLAIADLISQSGIVSLLSIGSGNSVVEYFIKKSCPMVDITVCDHDAFVMGKVKKIFPELNAKVFDFVSDDVSMLGDQFDVAIFIGSSFVMSDDEYVAFLKRLQPIVKFKIFDCHTTLNDLSEGITERINVEILQRVKNRGNGKLIGYSRSEEELVSIYKQAAVPNVSSIRGIIGQEQIYVLEV